MTFDLLQDLEDPATGMTFLEDMDFEPACEAYADGKCESPAGWVLRRDSCPKCDRGLVMFCTLHKDETLRLQGQWVYCPVCGPHVVYRCNVKSVEPLR